MKNKKIKIQDLPGIEECPVDEVKSPEEKLLISFGFWILKKEKDYDLVESVDKTVKQFIKWYNENK